MITSTESIKVKKISIPLMYIHFRVIEFPKIAWAPLGYFKRSSTFQDLTDVKFYSRHYTWSYHFIYQKWFGICFATYCWKLSIEKKSLLLTTNIFIFLTLNKKEIYNDNKHERKQEIQCNMSVLHAFGNIFIFSPLYDR